MTKESNYQPQSNKQSHVTIPDKKEIANKISHLDNMKSSASLFLSIIKRRLPNNLQLNTENINKEEQQNNKIYNSKSFNTSSIILNYMLFFIQKNKSFLISVYFVTFLAVLTSKFAEFSNLVELSSNKNFIFQLINEMFFSFIGIICLRKCLLNKENAKKTPILTGYPTFLGLHIAISLMTIASLLIVSNMIMHMEGYEYSKLVYIPGTIVASITTSILLLRFGYMIPAILYQTEDSEKSTLIKLKPYGKSLLGHFVAIKLICLNSVIYIEYIITDFSLIIIQSLMITLYHILIYILLGTSFRLANKQQ